MWSAHHRSLEEIFFFQTFQSAAAKQNDKTWNGGTVDRWISEDAEWRNILKRRMPFRLEQKSQKIKSH